MTIPLLLCASLSAQYGFEYHSYNDMRQWPSLISRKDPSVPLWLKIDPHYSSDREFCKSQGFDTSDCMVLNHDDLNTTGLVAYNTTNQLIDVVGMFPSGTHIALCAKVSGDPCLNPGWLSFSKDLFKKLTPAAQAADVTLVLDGGFAPVEGKTCLYDNFLPWNSTIAPTDTKSATSDSGYHGRLQVLNMPMTEPNPFSVISKVTPPFGKYQSHQPQRPFLVWEPMDEDQIRQVKTQFDAVAPSQTDVVRFANNQDPFQLLNYLTAVDANVSQHSIVTSSGQVLQYEDDHWGDFINLTDASIDQIEILSSDPRIVYVAALSKATATVYLNAYANAEGGAAVVSKISLAAAGLQLSTKHNTVFMFDTNQNAIVSVDFTTNGPSTVVTHSHYNVQGNVTSFVFLPNINSILYTNGDGNVYLNSTQRVGAGMEVKGTAYKSSMLISVKDSFCFNNDKYNKQANIKLCDLEGKSTENVGALAILPGDVQADDIRFHPCNDNLVFAGIGVLSQAFPTTLGKIYYRPISGSCKPKVCGCPVVRSTGSLRQFDITQPLG